MNPLLWIDAIAMWGAQLPHTAFAMLWSVAVTAALLACDRRPFPALAYYGAYVLSQTFGGFLLAGWVMGLIHG